MAYLLHDPRARCTRTRPPRDGRWQACRRDSRRSAPRRCASSRASGSSSSAAARSASAWAALAAAFGMAVAFAQTPRDYDAQRTTPRACRSSSLAGDRGHAPPARRGDARARRRRLLRRPRAAFLSEGTPHAAIMTQSLLSAAAVLRTLVALSSLHERGLRAPRATALSRRALLRALVRGASLLSPSSPRLVLPQSDFFSL